MCALTCRNYVSKGGSQLSDWESRDCKIGLWACPVSVVAQDHMFLFCSRDWKNINKLERFFQSLANEDVKVNKTQRISAKIDRFRTRPIVWILMQLISQSGK